jgi:hypothetical protein
MEGVQKSASHPSTTLELLLPPDFEKALVRNCQHIEMVMISKLETDARTSSLPRLAQA